MPPTAKCFKGVNKAMTFVRKAKNKIRKLQFKIRDRTINKEYRSRLTNTDFSIISSDCTGGLICHDLNVRFNSPTVNLYFMASDFIFFLKNLKEFIDSGEITPLELEGIDHPVAKMSIPAGEIVLYLVHYKSVAEFKEKWEERKVRINYDNLFVAMNDRNECTYDLIKEFVLLPYKNKVCFTHKKYAEFDSAFYLPAARTKNIWKRYLITCISLVSNAFMIASIGLVG